MKVNHLCFDPQDFLRLVGDCEEGEIIYFQNNVSGCFWKGYTMKGYRVISIMRDKLEVLQTLERFQWIEIKEVKT